MEIDGVVGWYVARADTSKRAKSDGVINNARYRKVLLDPALAIPRSDADTRALREKQEAWRRLAVLLNEIDAVLSTARKVIGEAFYEEMKREILNNFRRSGKPVGDKPTKAENRKMIEILRQLSPWCGDTNLKQLAPPGKDPINWENATRVQLTRFCARVAKTWMDLGRPNLEMWNSHHRTAP